MPLLNDYLAIRKANLGGPFLAHVQFCVTKSRHAVFSYESGASNGKESLKLEQKPSHFSVTKLQFLKIEG